MMESVCVYFGIHTPTQTTSAIYTVTTPDSNKIYAHHTQI